MRSVTVHEAKANLSKLIERARRGEEVIIARGATPVFRLVPVGEVQERRPPAALRGKLRVGPELGHFKTAYRASFQRLVSIVQQTFVLGPLAKSWDQTARLRALAATLSLSTTVMPRVNSLLVSTSTWCSPQEVAMVGSSAMDMATGSGREMPSSPVCSR